MKFEELRERHRILRYRSYSISRGRDHILLKYEFELDPGITFCPELVIEASSELSDEELAPFAFHVGLAEIPSYWKCACPREIIIEAGYLDDSQIAWWYDLLLHGLGEFYYRNGIDFTRPEFLSIRSNSDLEHEMRGPIELSNNGGFVLTAGGKDSSLTLELLKEYRDELSPLLLNPNRCALESANIAGFSNPVVMRRRIDPSLLALNEQGYLNGHTPFSSYLGFASLFAAAATGRSELIVSNEKSANQENIVFNDLPINHQYSKSYRYEQMFRRYVENYLTTNVSYFSILRPVYDLQVAGLFSYYCKEHFKSFRSCNVGSKKDTWCGSCPKCAFTFLALSAFCTDEQLIKIWGQDLGKNSKVKKHLADLLGIEDIKPFECVGTIEESRQALMLALQGDKRQSRESLELFKGLESKLKTENLNAIALGEVSSEHFVPESYLYLIEDALLEVFSNA